MPIAMRTWLSDSATRDSRAHPLEWDGDQLRC